MKVFLKQRSEIDRRCFIRSSAVVILTSHMAKAQRSGTSLESQFSEKLHKLQGDPELAGAMRRGNAQGEDVGGTPERSRPRAPKSKTAISTRASDLIVACEVTSKDVYIARYQAPVWPGGASGVTIGIGYDLGYVNVNNLGDDWAQYLDSATVKSLSAACGTKGTAAAELISQFPKQTKIKWDAAESQFYHETLPRVVGDTEAALPNTNELSADSLGALVSLVYNRGASFDVSGSRYQEMNKIKAAMRTGDFHSIPHQIRAMKRIWEDDPDMRGLLLRRDAEADLFQLGLQA